MYIVIYIYIYIHIYYTHNNEYHYDGSLYGVHVKFWQIMNNDLPNFTIASYHSNNQ